MPKVENDLDLDLLDLDLPWLKYAELNPINSKSQESISEPDLNNQKDLSSNTTLAIVPSTINEEVQNKTIKLPSTAASSRPVISKDLIAKPIQETMQHCELSTTFAIVPSQTNQELQNKATELPSTAASSNHVVSKDLIAKPIQETMQHKWKKPCELCGFEFQKQKQPKQQWLDHFAWKHYKERIEADLSNSINNFSCPLCDHVSKFKQNLFRHYGGTHNMIEKYISEDITNGTFIPSMQNQDVTTKAKHLPIKKQKCKIRRKPLRACELCEFKENASLALPKKHNRQGWCWCGFEFLPKKNPFQYFLSEASRNHYKKYEIKKNEKLKEIEDKIDNANRDTVFLPPEIMALNSDAMHHVTNDSFLPSTSCNKKIQFMLNLELNPAWADNFQINQRQERKRDRGNRLERRNRLK